MEYFYMNIWKCLAPT